MGALEKLLNEKNKRNVITKSEFKLNLEKFIPLILYKCDPFKYGALFDEKLIYSQRALKRAGKSDLGECFYIDKIYNQKRYCEIKITRLHKDGKTYRLTHLRDYQNFNYFIICFVDTSDKYKPYFYILPKDIVCDNPHPNARYGIMNGSEIANTNNENFETALNFNKKFLHELFDEHNLLKGTDLSDLTNFFNSNRHDHNSPPFQKIFSGRNQNRNIPNGLTINNKILCPIYYFNVEENKFNPKSTLIKDDNTADAFAKLIKYIGVKIMQKFITDINLNKIQTNTKNIPVTNGYFLKHDLSLITIRKIINKFNKLNSNNMKITILKK